MWTFHDSIKYEFDLEFDIPVSYPSVAPELALPELDGKTEKMYRGGKARAAPPPLPLRLPLLRAACPRTPGSSPPPPAQICLDSHFLWDRKNAVCVRVKVWQPTPKTLLETTQRAPD